MTKGIQIPVLLFGSVNDRKKDLHSSAAFTVEKECSACWTSSFFFLLLLMEVINYYWQSSLNLLWKNISSHLRVPLLLSSWCHLLVFAIEKGYTCRQSWSSYVGAMQRCFSWQPLGIQRYLEFSHKSDKTVWFITWALLTWGILSLNIRQYMLMQYSVSEAKNTRETCISVPALPFSTIASLVIFIRTGFNLFTYLPRFIHW